LKAIQERLTAARVDIYVAATAINTGLKTGNNAVVVEYVVKLMGVLLPAFQAHDDYITALEAENAMLRDLLMSAVHGQNIISMNGEHIARLVDGELVMDTWRKGTKQ